MANKISNKTRKWLFYIHILSMSAWVGILVPTIFIGIVAAFQNNTDMVRATWIISSTLIMPIAAGIALITGILLSVLTNWGLFKHRWIITKFIITILILPAGPILFGNFLRKMNLILTEENINSFQNVIFLSNQKFFLSGTVILAAITFFLMAISIFKPWGTRKKK